MLEIEVEIIRAIETIFTITNDKSIRSNRRILILKIIYEALENKKITNSEAIEKAFQIMKQANFNFFGSYYGYIDDYRFVINQISRIVDESFFDKYFDMFPKDELIKNTKFSEKFLETRMDELDKEFIAIYQNLSVEFIEKHIRKLSLYHLLISQQLSAGFLNKHKAKIKTMLTQKKYKDLPKKIKENNKLDTEAMEIIDSILLLNAMRM